MKLRARERCAGPCKASHIRVDGRCGDPHAFCARCIRAFVMQTQLAGRKLIMVFLDSSGKYSRLGDAERMRRWIEAEPARLVVTPATTRIPVTAAPKISS